MMGDAQACHSFISVHHQRVCHWVNRPDKDHVWASFGPHTATIKRHALYLNSGHGGDLVLMSLKQNTSFQFQPTQALFQYDRTRKIQQKSHPVEAMLLTAWLKTGDNEPNRRRVGYIAR